MSKSAAPAPGGTPVNNLISLLPRPDRDAIHALCEPTELKFGTVLCQPDDPIEHVYFPTDSFISLITPTGAAESLEVGLVGSEGIFGITLLLDVKTSPLLGLVQGGGRALRMRSSRFTKAARDNKAFRSTLNRYMYALTAQLAQTSACNRFHNLDTRMARWLLMTHDRAHRDTFLLTHQFLAYMLGVRRAGITEAAGRLQAMQLIRYTRGQLTVLDRDGLEAESCACYDAVRQTYSRHVGKLNGA
ncbi:MAG: Crp/Fnr family transcriptional regulator [Betaproteobacteria bacterium]